VNTLTGRSTRTITGYVIQLLEFPRWYIERDVDFTHCRHSGRFDHDDSECVNCHFGTACQWLNQERSPDVGRGSATELVAALEAAVEYLQTRIRHDRGCHCDNCSWLREARRFLHNRHD